MEVNGWGTGLDYMPAECLPGLFKSPGQLLLLLPVAEEIRVHAERLSDFLKTTQPVLSQQQV